MHSSHKRAVLHLVLATLSTHGLRPWPLLSPGMLISSSNGRCQMRCIFSYWSGAIADLGGTPRQMRLPKSYQHLNLATAPAQCLDVEKGDGCALKVQ
eukprot:2190440-Amphidinium_carterae.1